MKETPPIKPQPLEAFDLHRALYPFFQAKDYPGAYALVENSSLPKDSQEYRDLFAEVHQLAGIYWAEIIVADFTKGMDYYNQVLATRDDAPILNSIYVALSDAYRVLPAPKDTFKEYFFAQMAPYPEVLGKMFSRADSIVFNTMPDKKDWLRAFNILEKDGRYEELQAEFSLENLPKSELPPETIARLFELYSKNNPGQIFSHWDIFIDDLRQAPEKDMAEMASRASEKGLCQFNLLLDLAGQFSPDFFESLIATVAKRATVGDLESVFRSLPRDDLSAYNLKLSFYQIINQILRHGDQETAVRFFACDDWAGGELTKEDYQVCVKDLPPEFDQTFSQLAKTNNDIRVKAEEYAFNTTSKLVDKFAEPRAIPPFLQLLKSSKVKRLLLDKGSKNLYQTVLPETKVELFEFFNRNFRNLAKAYFRFEDKSLLPALQAEAVAQPVPFIADVVDFDPAAVSSVLAPVRDKFNRQLLADFKVIAPEAKTKVFNFQRSDNDPVIRSILVEEVCSDLVALAIFLSLEWPPAEVSLFLGDRVSPLDPRLRKNLLVRASQISPHQLSQMLIYCQTLGWPEFQADIQTALQTGYRPEMIKVVLRLPKPAFDYYVSEKTIKLVQKKLPSYEDVFEKTDKDKVVFFMHHLISHGAEINLSPQSLEDFTAFVQRFGLLKYSELYNQVVSLFQFERGQLEELPAALKESGLDSLSKFEERVSQLSQAVVSGQLPPPGDLHDFDYGIIDSLTNFSASAWAKPNFSLSAMYARFYDYEQSGKIHQLKPEYEPDVLRVAKVEKQAYDFSYCQDEFQRFKQGLILAHEVREQGFSWLLEKVNGQTASALAALESEEPAANQFQAKAREVKLAALRALLAQLQTAEHEDQLLQTLVDYELKINEKNENQLTSPFIRTVLFKKAIDHHSGFADLPADLELQTAPTMDSLIYLRNLIHNLLKQHVVLTGADRQLQNADPDPAKRALQQNVLDKKLAEAREYFRDGFFPSVKAAFRLNKNIASPRMNEFFQRQSEVKSDRSTAISMVPDRGFVGELSGYYGDACWTSQEDYLFFNPSITPFKFVLDKDSSPAIIGCVLFIEAELINNEKVLIVRGLNPRDEYLGDLSAASFCEQVFDSAAKTAKRLGIKKVLMAGTSGSDSNRQKITAYLSETYFLDEKNVILDKSLAFNGYELQHGCFLVRSL